MRRSTAPEGRAASAVGLIPIKMHELSLCQDIVRAIERAARERGFTRVLRVELEIGVLAGVEIEALRFGFKVAARDSVADGAHLAD